MYTPRWKQYAEIEDETKRESSNGRDYDENYRDNSSDRSSRETHANRILRILERIALGVLSLWFLSSFFYLEESCPPRSRLLPSELPFAEEAIQYEDVTFSPSGFHQNESDKTPWEGPFNAATEAAWAKIVDVGNLALTKEEYESTGLTTTEIETEPGKYLVTVEMFHQLHCLHTLKQTLNGHPPPGGTPHLREQHLSHCIDYLRQVLMCHGDLTPITFYIDEERNKTVPNFEIRHTCRSFERIREWAGARGSEGAGGIE